MMAYETCSMFSESGTLHASLLHIGTFTSEGVWTSSRIIRLGIDSKVQITVCFVSFSTRMLRYNVAVLELFACMKWLTVDECFRT